eukprot:scaffold77878_cov55-Phaeocystis_antarctica.AAC.3
MWDGSELTRRASGDHGQRQKRGWGAKQQSPPSCTRGLAATAPRARSDRLGSDRCLHTSASAWEAVASGVLLLVSRSASKGPLKFSSEILHSRAFHAGSSLAYTPLQIVESPVANIEIAAINNATTYHDTITAGAHRVLL